MNSPREHAARDTSARLRADAALAVGIACVVAMLIVPLPTWLLDLLIASNLAVSLLLLLVSLGVRDGLAFSSLPTLLLITTLFRLALNVSSTRLILLQADAGQIIRAFGDFVVRGDYAVGGVLFFVLTVVQYVVVARGAERVAEVGARFSLDALPGKQLAIDADVRLGALTPARASARRAELERESRFYGAMDGAMKFVKGDAIAGIVIAVVCFVAGGSLGALRSGLSLGDSLRLYGLLTIGDALVSQIPSLLVATSAGLVVTRVASGDDSASLGGDLAAQLFGRSRALWATAAFFATLALLPGLPGVPFGALALAIAWAASSRMRAERSASSERGRALDEPSPLRIELGAQAAQLVLASTATTRALRDALDRALDGLGVPALAPQLATLAALPARGYRIVLGGAPISSGELHARALEDACAELAAELERVAPQHASAWLGVDETQALLDAAAKQAPVLVHQLVPTALSLRALTLVLQRLLAERIPLRPLRPILEAIAVEHAADSTRAPLELVERVRSRLARQITTALQHEGALRAHALDPMIEDAVRESVVGRGDGAYLALRPELAADIVASIRSAVTLETTDRRTGRAVLLAQPDVRRWLRVLIEAELPEVSVLSYAELPADLVVERREPVRVRAA